MSLLREVLQGRESETFVAMCRESRRIKRAKYSQDVFREVSTLTDCIVCTYLFLPFFMLGVEILFCDFFDHFGFTLSHEL